MNRLAPSFVWLLGVAVAAAVVPNASAQTGVLLALHEHFSGQPENDLVEPCSSCDCCSVCGEQENASCLDCFLPRYTGPLPFLQSLVPEDATLPPPLGISVVSTEMDRPVVVSDVRLGVGGNPPESADALTIGDLTAHASSQIVRFDAWILPFLNMYSFVGHTRTEANVLVNVDAFPGLPGSVEIPVHAILNGTTYGGGGTVAYGSGDYFATLDMNYSKTDFNPLSSELSCFVLAPRVGKVIERPFYKGEIHIGAMYQKASRTIDLDIDGLRVQIDEYEPKQWNALIGTLYAIDERLHLLVEYGFGGREYLISSLVVRF